MYTLRVINKDRNSERNFYLGRYYEVLNPIHPVFKEEFKEGGYPPEVSCMVSYQDQSSMCYNYIEIEEHEHAFIVNENGQTHRRIKTNLEKEAKEVRDEMVKTYWDAINEQNEQYEDEDKLSTTEK
jgi:hypothetical protein